MHDIYLINTRDMESVLKRIFILALLLGAASFTQAASFECAKAVASTDKRICADSELSALDTQMAQAYKQAIARAGNAELVKAAQREWLRKERNACADTQCMKAAYAERVVALNADQSIQIPPAADLLDTPATVSASASGQAPERGSDSAPVISSESNAAHSEAPAADGSITTVAAPVQVPAAAAAPAPATASTTANVTASTTSPAPPVAIPAEKPSQGIAGVFNAIYVVLTMLFVAGLINPGWILRWHAQPGRKHVLVYFLVAALPFGLLGELTKTKATQAYEAKMRADKQAERDAAAAREKALDAERMAVQAARSRQGATMSAQEWKLMCTKGGMLAMALVAAKADGNDTRGIYENFDDWSAAYPPNLRAGIRNTWQKGMDFADKRLDARVYNSEQVVTLVTQACFAALKRDGLI